MRAEVGEVPWTAMVTPVVPESASALEICELLKVWRTVVPSSTWAAAHGALLASATTNASAGETVTAWTTARQ